MAAAEAEEYRAEDDPDLVCDRLSVVGILQNRLIWRVHIFLLRLATVGASASHLSFVDRHSGDVTVLHVDPDLVIPMAQLLSRKVWRIHDKTWRGKSICNGSMDTRGESWVGLG